MSKIFLPLLSACHFIMKFSTSHNNCVMTSRGRKLNLLNWLLLLFRCSDFYIRHQPKWKMGEAKEIFVRDMCMGGEFMTFYRGVGFHLSHFGKGGVVEVVLVLCGYVKCVWLIKGYCQLLKLKISAHPTSNSLEYQMKEHKSHKKLLQTLNTNIISHHLFPSFVHIKANNFSFLAQSSFV